jgi:tRNA dimethylallyltransferase
MHSQNQLANKMRDAILIAGPTASGKSGLALAIAEHIDKDLQAQAVIINADSMQVYAELPTLTAAPRAEDKARCPHLLYEHIALDQAYSVGHWYKQAMRAVQEAKDQGHVPIIVGGTGLYFKALTHGLVDIPDIAPDIRKQLSQDLERLGLAGLQSELEAVDPASAARVHANDKQRILRALEVFRATGKSLTDWHASPHKPPLEGDIAKICLMPERDWLYERCDRRFEQMIHAGVIDEVRAVAAKVALGRSAGNILGLAELLEHLAGNLSLEAAISQAQQQTRRYAKRQMTWFRNQMIAWNVLDAKDYYHKQDVIFSIITKNDLTQT